MERQQSSFLDQLLFRRKLDIVSLDGLGEQFLLSLCREHLGEDRLALGDVAISESGQTELHDRSVVQDLSGDVGLSDSVLQMRHEEKVSGLVVVASGGVVENVSEDGSSSEQRGVRVVDVHGEQVDKTGSVSRLVEGGDFARHALDILGDGALESVDDDVGLRIDQ